MDEGRIARFDVRVKPGAARTGVGGAYGDPPALVVRVSAPAVDGRANAAVLAALAASLRVPPSSLRVARGDRSRSKVIAYSGTDTDVLVRVSDLRGSDAATPGNAGSLDGLAE